MAHADTDGQTTVNPMTVFLFRFMNSAFVYIQVGIYLFLTILYKDPPRVELIYFESSNLHPL